MTQNQRPEREVGLNQGGQDLLTGVRGWAKPLKPKWKQVRTTQGKGSELDFITKVGPGRGALESYIGLEFWRSITELQALGPGLLLSP